MGCHGISERGGCGSFDTLLPFLEVNGTSKTPFVLGIQDGYRTLSCLSLSRMAVASWMRSERRTRSEVTVSSRVVDGEEFDSI